MQPEIESLITAGATARATNRSMLDNPFYKAEKMPVATGERVADWSAKEEAWRLGWMLEDGLQNKPLVSAST